MNVGKNISSSSDICDFVINKNHRHFSCHIRIAADNLRHHLCSILLQFEVDGM